MNHVIVRQLRISCADGLLPVFPRKKFENGLHCVGLWHSHPEPLPTPSDEDKALAREHALAASGQLVGLIFAITGTRPMPDSLRVWIDDGEVLRMANAQTYAGEK